MSNNIELQSGERLSFYKLFYEKQYRVCIPRIQRDYAQGRQSKKEVRELFLGALYDYLEENTPNRDLDFVYGTLDKTADTATFIPLDGQQRLTTLFLLHWYLYQLSGNTQKKEEFKAYLYKSNKSMFTYETRSSSSEFCNALMGKNVNIGNLIEPDIDEDGISEENSLSKTIEDSPWFFLSWKRDPTIQSMLVMLDAIHGRFQLKPEFFERLIDTDYPIITFQLLNLKEFSLTDDLYIKMNSRGKPLTIFENFKAKLEKFLGSVETKRKFYLTIDNKEKEVSVREYFSHRIDTVWADLFWAYREVGSNKHVFDEELKNLIRVLLSNQYAIAGVNRDDFELLLDTDVAKKRKGYTPNLSYYKLEEMGAITEKSIIYLIDAFDSLVNGDKRIKKYLPIEYQSYFNEDFHFEKALSHSLSHSERVMLHAYIGYLRANEDRSGIGQWMRVIHNLVQNTRIDGANEVSGAIRSIEKLLIKSDDILKYLKDKTAIDFFFKWQVYEEQIKAFLITRGDEWKEAVESTEKRVGFTGQIGFVLEFSGIVDYFKKHGNLEWSGLDDDFYSSNVADYTDKAEAVFDEKVKYDSEYVLQRAVMTKGDYLLGSVSNPSSFRKNLLIRDTRDFSWKRLLIISDDNKEKRKFLQDVFDDALFDINNLLGSLGKMCKIRTRTWRDYLIDNTDMIKYCQQGFITHISDKNIILFGQSQRNHYHAEMYTYYLWKKTVEPRIKEIKSFKEAYYKEVKSEDENACIYFGGFCRDKKYYEAHICYYSQDELYKLCFLKTKGDKSHNAYGSDICRFLRKLQFSWSGIDDLGYTFSSRHSNDIIEKLKELDDKLCK